MKSAMSNGLAAVRAPGRRNDFWHGTISCGLTVAPGFIPGVIPGASWPAPPPTAAGHKARRYNRLRSPEKLATPGCPFPTAALYKDLFQQTDVVRTKRNARTALHLVRIEVRRLEGLGLLRVTVDVRQEHQDRACVVPRLAAAGLGHPHEFPQRVAAFLGVFFGFFLRTPRPSLPPFTLTPASARAARRVTTSGLAAATFLFSPMSAFRS